MDKTDVTNDAFEKFVKATGYVAVAERKPSAEDYPGAPPENLVAGSVVFTAPDHPVPLNDYFQWWTYVPGANYKGEFLLGNRQYCYPLTVTDHASRYLLTCEALSSVKEEYAFAVFERLFQERGLPANMRSDNGVPFASAHALFNLSKLSVWWLRLGIGIERIKPGHPQQNGRHERMHLTLKKEATKPASRNFLQQ